MPKEPPRRKLEGRDAARIIIGSLVLAFPVAVTEVALEALAGELSLAELAAKHDVHPNVIQ